MTDDVLVRRLVDKLGVDAVQLDPSVVQSYAQDQSGLTSSARPVAVVRPRSTAEVSAVLSTAHQLGRPVVARGAGSGLSGGANAMDGAIVVSFGGMAEILRMDADERVAVVQPGVVTAQLKEAARELELSYPPDPASVEFSTIGGNIATNAGGLCCVKYGVTRDYVMALEVVLADGRVCRTGRSTRKSVAGYDLTSLFVGSEGTLGLVTEATLRLVPAAKSRTTGVATYSSVEAAVAAGRQLDSGGAQPPCLLELMDATTLGAVNTWQRSDVGDDAAAMLLVQFDDASHDVGSLEKLLSGTGAVAAYATDDVQEEQILLSSRRAALPAMEAIGDVLLDDVAVPLTRVAELCQQVAAIAERERLTIGTYGHLGDGNLHPTIVYDRTDEDSVRRCRAAFEAILEAALALGGTITGEHGVGTLKAGFLESEIGPVALAVHRSVKAALDPTHILNPGTILTDACRESP